MISHRSFSIVTKCRRWHCWLLRACSDSAACGLLISTTLGIVLAGCSGSSTGVHKIYLTSLSYSRAPLATSLAQVNSNLTATFATLVNGAALQVRASYFGLCVTEIDGNWVCSRDAKGLAGQFQPPQDPLDLISISARFKDGIVFSGLMYAISDFLALLWLISVRTPFSLLYRPSRCRGVVLLYRMVWTKNTLCCRIAAIIFAIISIYLFSTFPGWHEEIDDDGQECDVRPFPSPITLNSAFTTSTLASLLALVSMLWQHIASVAAATTAENMAYGTVKSLIGLNAMALGWAGVASFVLASIGTFTLIRGTSILDSLTDEKSTDMALLMQWARVGGRIVFVS